MRAKGEDPYRYEKARLARATMALRVGMRREHQRRVARRALPWLEKHLRALARRRDLSKRRLRRLLFELWDECEERRGSKDDREVARQGERARRLIIAFIRRRLPSAYGAAELRRLNQRRSSRARFTPHRRLATK